MHLNKQYSTDSIHSQQGLAHRNKKVKYDTSSRVYYTITYLSMGAIFTKAELIVPELTKC